MTTDDRQQIKARISANKRIQGDYFQIDLDAPEIAATARPGQFVHVRISGMEHRILRRPFSIFDTDAAAGRLSLVYKVVGEGSRRLSELPSGETLDVLGPLGNGFSPMPENGIIVAGGFGCAATYLLAKQAIAKPWVLLGGRSAIDILLEKEYRDLGCRVEISTDDGSLGMQGRVTALLESVIREDTQYWVASCGPIPMLRTLAGVMAKHGINGELSMDNAMCCGVGACFACVTKVKDASEQGWRYARVCNEGPIFAADRLVWE